MAAQVEDDAPAALGDRRHGRVELRSAVAAPGPEDIAGEALGVHPDQDARVRCDVACRDTAIPGVAEHQRNML